MERVKASPLERLIQSAFPQPRLEHLLSLTDDTGVIQHCIGKVPDRSTGYTTDDVARALLLALREEVAPAQSERLISVCLPFLLHAQRGDGWFRNQLSYDRRWEDEGGSEDCFGRALWALAKVRTSELDPSQKFAAERALRSALPLVNSLQSLRGRSFSILALSSLLLAGEGSEEERELLERLADSLVDDFRGNSSPNWRWFEDILTYANARPLQALYSAYLATGNDRYLEVAEEAGEFLWEVTFDGECFVPIGNRGWYPRGGRRAVWAQQALEAGCAVEAELEAYRATEEETHLERALIAWEWYEGRNMLGIPLYEPESGVCHDGLEPDGLNLNCGAEATISCLHALLALREVARAFSP